MNSLRTQAEDLFKPLNGTSYFAQGSTIKADINVSLDKVIELQKSAYTPESRIRAYREAMIEINGAERKIEDMKTLTASAGSMGNMFGFIGGVSTIGVFGIIMVVIVGIAFLGMLFKMLFAGKTIKVIAEDGGEKVELARINFWEKIKNGFNGVKNGLKNGAGKIKDGVKKEVKIGIIILLVFGAVVFGVKAFGYLKNSPSAQYKFSAKQEQEQTSPSPSPSPTPEPTPSPLEKKVKVLENNVNYLNVREGPGVESNKITRVESGEEFVELERKENDIGEEWVKIKVDEETEGWVLGEYVVVTQEPEPEPEEQAESQEIELTDEKQVLGAEEQSRVMIVVSEEVNAINVRSQPSLDSEVLTKFWISQEVNKLGEEEDWVKIEIEVEKDGVKYSEGWIIKGVVQEIEE